MPHPLGPTVIASSGTCHQRPHPVGAGYPQSARRHRGYSAAAGRSRPQIIINPKGDQAISEEAWVSFATVFDRSTSVIEFRRRRLMIYMSGTGYADDDALARLPTAHGRPPNRPGPGVHRPGDTAVAFASTTSTSAPPRRSVADGMESATFARRGFARSPALIASGPGVSYARPRVVHHTMSQMPVRSAEWHEIEATASSGRR